MIHQNPSDDLHEFLVIANVQGEMSLKFNKFCIFFHDCINTKLLVQEYVQRKLNSLQEDFKMAAKGASFFFPPCSTGGDIKLNHLIAIINNLLFQNSQN